MTRLYVVRAFYDGTFTDYEYSNINHAESHFNMEECAMILLYESDNQNGIKTESIINMKGEN